MRFSYSKVSCYKQCPYKFKLNYIDKIPVSIKSDALVKGTKIHSLLENFETLDTNAEHADIVLKFANSPLGKDILSKNSTREWCVKFDTNLNADDSLNTKTAYFIGYIDRINATQDGVELIDFKTGKYKDPRWQDYEQLSIYGLYMFSKFQHLKSLKLRYVYVEHSQENARIMESTEVPVFKNLLLNTLKEIETAVEYPKKPQKLCQWCEFYSICQKPDK